MPRCAGRAHFFCPQGRHPARDTTSGGEHARIAASYHCQAEARSWFMADECSRSSASVSDERKPHEASAPSLIRFKQMSQSSELPYFKSIARVRYCAV